MHLPMKYITFLSLIGNAVFAVIFITADPRQPSEEEIELFITQALEQSTRQAEHIRNQEAEAISKIDFSKATPDKFIGVGSIKK